MQERGWEHHVVSVEPELSSILSIEHILVSSFAESASGEDKHGRGEVVKEARVVKSAIHVSEESGPNWTHGSVDTEDRHPHVVHHSESSVESVGGVLSLAHLEGLEESSNRAGSHGKSLIDQVLKGAGVFEQPSLYSLRHIY